MTLNKKIIQIYPELSDTDFNPISGIIRLQDDSDGKGPYIRLWNYSKPQPTQDELDAIE